MVRRHSAKAGMVNAIPTRLGQGRILIWFTTLDTPGADQAERSASWRSAQVFTVPLSVILLPSTSTSTRWASTWALRTSASRRWCRHRGSSRRLPPRSKEAAGLRLHSSGSSNPRMYR